MTRGTQAGRDLAEPGEQFTVPDEVCCYFDTPDEPANIHLELCIPGRLDRAQFRAAALAALGANPRTSRRRAPGHRMRTGYRWERPARLDHDPISFTTWRDAEDLARQRSAFVAEAPSIDRAPGAALLVATGSDGDYVILNAHHAVMDGLSWLDLLRDLARRYRAATGVAAGVQATAVRGPEVAAAPAPSGQRRRGPADLLAGLRSVPRPPARIAAERGGGHGCGVLLYLLPSVPGVPLAAAADQRITLNDALITALIATISDWNADHGKPRRPVRVTVPINARSASEQGAAGNHSRLVTISATVPDGGLPALLVEVARQTRHARQQPGQQVPAGTRALAAMPLPATAKRWLVRATLRVAGRLICDTVLLTNLGNVAGPPEFGLGGTVTMGLTGPAQMPRGLSLAVITAGGKLQLGFRYNRALLDETAAASFAARYLGTLAALTRAPGDGGETVRPPGGSRAVDASMADKSTYPRS